MAKKKDEERKQLLSDGKKVPIMHGIPIAIKDNISQNGKLATVGCAFLCIDPCEDDAAVVQMYLKAGAIPIIRANCSQGDLLFYADNKMWGRALNPINNARVCSGEAGLVASKSVPFALGTEVAGSLNIPAGFCGVYSLKPTHGRVSAKGVVPARRNRYNKFN